MTEADVTEEEKALLEQIDKRITFHNDLHAMEADFSNFQFNDTLSVNLFYDQIERRIRATGEEKWFFLVNLNGTLIEPAAWFVYSRRGRALNLAHSAGSVRFDASDATRKQIKRAAQTDAFDPNLFATREEAIDRIRKLPAPKRKPKAEAATITREEVARRITFDDSATIMEADLSDLTLENSADADTVFDYLEEKIIASDRRWFFLVNLNHCKIMPGAWVRYAHRGKHLNKAGSLGSARFAAGSETEEEIRMRAESQHFRPNIRNTREEALDLIEEMREELTHG